MTTNNVLNNSLSGKIGTGSFVGSTSPTLVTPIAGVASATSLSFSNTSEVIGTTTNDSAASGSVGEYVESHITSGSPTSMPVSGTFYDITSISLTAGDWNVWGNLTITFTGSAYALTVWTSSSSASYPGNENVCTLGGQPLTPFISAVNGTTCVVRRFSLASTTTIYLTGIGYYTTGTANGCGLLAARRVR